MKIAFAIVVLAVAATQCSAVTLKDEFDELIAMVPIPAIQEVFDKHMGSNPELQKIVAYFQSDDWKQHEEAIKALPEVQELKEYISNVGIDCDFLLRSFHEFIEKAKPTGTGNKTLKDFILDILDVIPKEKIAATMVNKLMQSKPVRDFYNVVAAPKYQKLFEKIIEMPESKKIRKMVEDMNIQVKPILDSLCIFFGWKMP